MNELFHGLKDGVGDTHRFGARVQRDASLSPAVFVKPRSTQIEELFLDQANAWSYFSRLFGFRIPGSVICEESWLGLSQDLGLFSVTSPFRRDREDSYAQAAGVWIALSTFLGITEQTADNVLMIQHPNGYAPVSVDIENLFYDVRSGIETGWIHSGIKAQMLEGYRPLAPDVLLDSFLRTAETCISVLPDLLRELEISLSGCPIRVFLRPTADYRLFQGRPESIPGQPLLTEEYWQLRARDIPYFFTFRDEPRLYCFSERYEIEECDAKHFSSVLMRAHQPIRELVRHDRLRHMLKLTALQIAHHFFPKEDNQSLVGEHFEFNCSDSKIFLKTKRFAVGTELSST